MTKVQIWAGNSIVAIILVVVLLAVTSGVRLTLAAPLQQGTINKVYIYDVYSNGFSVSWTTAEASNGIVNYGTSIPPGSSVSDSVTSTTTHHVMIGGLSPNTTYYISVQSGALIDDNGGSYYTVTTGPNLSIPDPRGSLGGYVYENDGETLVPHAIVYMRLRDNDGSGSLGDSQWVTTRTGDDGSWYYTLGGIRTSNLSSYFSYSDGTDNIQFVVQGGDKGVIGETGAVYIIPVPTDPFVQIDFTLDAVPNAVRLVNFEATNSRTNNYALWIGLGVSLLALATILLLRVRRLG